MALFSSLKKKLGKTQELKKIPESVESGEKRSDETPRHSTSAASSEGRSSAAHVLLQPHITEKTSQLASLQIYTFRISPRATKRSIRDAVERIYNVEVNSVKVITVPSKERMRGRMLQGMKRGYRKALVRLKEGHTIAEFLRQ